MKIDVSQTFPFLDLEHILVNTEGYFHHLKDSQVTFLKYVLSQSLQFRFNGGSNDYSIY